MNLSRGRCFTLVIFSLVLFALALLTQTSRANAQSEVSFEGKTVRILVSSSAGGGTDSAGRVMARFLPKFLPGKPSVFVQNMPGGGGILANNYFYKRGKQNGLDLFQASSSTVTQFNRGGKRVRWDPQKWMAVGSINRGGSLLMIRKDVRSRLTDPKAEPVVVGDADGSRNWLAVPVWGHEYLKWNTRYIYGYSGTSDMILALRQGEIEMMGTANVTLIEDLLKDGVVEIICTASNERRRDYPNIKSFEEVLGGKRPAGVSWQAYRFWLGPSDLDKLVVLPPGTPDNIVRTYREAYQKMAKDPEFQKVTTTFFGDGWIIRGGKETEGMVVETTTASKEVKDFLRKMRKKHGLPEG